MSDKTKQIGTFDVLREMCARKMDVRLSTMDNVTNMTYSKTGKCTKVTIGVDGDVLNPIWRGQLVGGLLLADKDQFFEIKEILEAQAERGDKPNE
jgi:hypothetical protein